MKIGVNYLLESRELFEEGKIDFVDYFKLYSLNSDLSAVDWCIKNKGLMFHGSIGTSSFLGDKDIINKIDVEKTKEILNNSVAPYFSAHICSREDHSLEEYCDIFKDNISVLKNALNREVVLENIPYRNYRSNSTALLNPEVISKIVYDNNIKFLFDISHARRSALYYNMSLEEFASKLPMDRCIEVHLAGMFKYPNIDDENIAKDYSENTRTIIKSEIEKFGPIFDNHGIMNEEDYIFLEKLIKDYPQIEYITLEYGSYNDNSTFRDEDFPYPVCNFNKVNPKAKEEVLEQLLRINQIVKGS